MAFTGQLGTFSSRPGNFEPGTTVASGSTAATAAGAITLGGTVTGRAAATSTAGTITLGGSATGAAPTVVPRVQVATATNFLATSANKTSITATLATGATAGNLIVVGVAVDKAAGTFTAPAGYTLIGALASTVQISLAAFYKVATGGETSATVTWSTAQDGGTAIIAEYSGVDTTTPIDGIDLPAYSDTARTSMSLDPPAATVAGRALAFFAQDSISSGLVPYNTSQFQPSAAGWTPQATAWTSANGNGCPPLVLEERAADVAASENIAATTFSWLSSDQTAGMAILLRAGSGTVTPTLTHRIVGIPTSTTAYVSARTTAATSVRLQVSTSATFASGIISGSAVTPNAQGDSQLTVSGLSAGTAYYHRVGMTVGAVETFSAISTVPFKTAPTGATSFNFSFSSCCDATDSTAMATIAARGDDLFFHLGDLYYADGTGTTTTNFRAKYAAKIQATNHAAVLASTPSGYQPSDHDGMTNGSTGTTDATAWTNWNTVYREMWPTQTLPTSGVYYTYTWGRVRFIHLDTRTFKGAANTTALGATQKAWLKDTITAATEAVIVIVQGDSSWIGTGDADQWAGYTTERTELANFFAASGKRIGMLAGDAHMLAGDDGSNAPGGIFLFQAAPLNNSASQKGGPYTSGPYPASGTAVVEQYGRVAVTDTGSAITLAYTGYSADNTARVTTSVTFAAATAAGSITLGGSVTAQAPATTTGGTLTLGGTATASAGAPTTTGSITLGGSGTAQARPGSTGTITLGGTAAAPTAAATTAGTLTLGGSVTATAAASATGTITLGSGTVSAAARPTAAGSLTLSGTGTGSVPGVNTATGSITLGGSPTAAARPTTTGTVTLGGSSTPTARASLTGLITLGGTATGAIGTQPATATGGIVLGGAITARVPATAAGLLTLSGIANAIDLDAVIVVAGPRETLTVQPETRVLTVGGEIRTLTVAAEARVLTSAGK